MVANIQDLAKELALEPVIHEQEQEAPFMAFPEIEINAYQGIIKDVTQVAIDNTEASRMAVAVTFVEYFCSMIGRSIYYPIGDYDLHCRPFSLLVGRSGKARKGTSEYLVDRIFKQYNAKSMQPLAIHGGGLSSGEGICYAIRDPSKDEKGKDDPGVSDKRLLVVESEFGNTLVNCKRESSILSGVIRNLFDGKRIAPLTKNNRIRASEPHVCLLGHITIDEMHRKLKGTSETSNGLLNRFLIYCVRRERLMAMPTRTSESMIARFAEEVADIQRFAATGKQEISMSREAAAHWKRLYPLITQEQSGIMGDLTARHDTYTLMLSMIFALLDKRKIIEPIDLDTACIWVDYAQQSIRYIFSSSEQEAKAQGLTELASKILDSIKDKPLSRTEISNALCRNYSSKDIDKALTDLLSTLPPSVKVTKMPTAGRAREVFSHVN